MIQAKQDDRELPVEIRYDKSIWSGLSWVAGEIRATGIKSSSPITIQCISMEPSDITMQCRVFSVSYK